MIKKNIKRDDVINAIREVDLNGVPNNRESTKYRLMYNDRSYPPKIGTCCIKSNKTERRKVKEGMNYGFI